MTRNILLTGGTGFLGSHLLKKLIELNYNVIVLVRPTSNLFRIENLQGNFKLFCIEDNLSNLNELFFQYKIDTIIHTSTEYGRVDSLMSKILQTNLIFPIRLVEEGLKNGLQLFINSDTFFGKQEYSNSSYLGSYIVSKNYFTNYLKEESIKGLRVANMRLEHVFGEFDSKTKFVTSLINQLIDNKKEILLTEALQKRDFIYVEDVVDGYLKVLEFNNKLENYTEFEVGTGESIEVNKFVKSLLKITNSKSKLKFGALPTREGEISDSKANNQKLKDLGWKPSYSIEKAIDKIIKIEYKK